MNLEDTIIHEKSQTQKALVNMIQFHLHDVPGAVTFIETENRTVVVSGWRQGVIGIAI